MCLITNHIDHLPHAHPILPTLPWSFAAQVDSASGLTVLAEERMQLEASAEGNYPGATRWNDTRLVEVVNGWFLQTALSQLRVTSWFGILGVPPK